VPLLILIGDGILWDFMDQTVIDYMGRLRIILNNSTYAISL
jgi:hypothetical protein